MNQDCAETIVGRRDVWEVHYEPSASPHLSWGRRHWAGLILLGCFLSQAAMGATYVNRDAQGNVRDVTLGANTAWTAANSPYVLEAHVTVGNDVALSVETGVTVQVSANKGLYVNGTLVANGAVFTVNGDGNWRGIYLSSASGASSLNGCTVSRAGADNLGYIRNGYRRAAIYVDNCAATIANCTIAESAAHGIELWPNGGTFRNNAFQNLAGNGYALVYDTVGTFPSVSGSSLTGSGIAGVWVARGTVTETQRWNYPGGGFAYYLEREINIAEGAKLSVDPGVTVKTTGGWFWVEGTLEALGTATQPIAFTSAGATPAAGDWYGIYLGGQAGGSTFDYVTVAYAGRDNLGYIHNAYRKTAVYVNASNPTFDHFTVLRSQFNGVELYGSSATFSNLTVQACGGHALKAEAGSRPLVSDASFLGNGTVDAGYYTIGTDASSVPTPVRTTFATNRLQGVQIWGGTLPADAVWRNWSDNAPYVLTADLTVQAGVTLTVEQGTTVKAQTAGLYVQGKLTAQGNPAAIIFSSWRDDTAGGDSNGDADQTTPAGGNWRGIYLGPETSGSVLDNCAIRYAGADNLGYIHNGYRKTGVYVDGAAVTIARCTFANSGGHGLELWVSPSLIQNNRFQDLAEGAYAVVYDNLSASVLPTVSGNTAGGTGLLGIAVPGGSLGGTNVWNRPGTNFPYYLNGEFTLAEGARLEVEPGTTFLSANQRILIYGTWRAMGTAAEPIVFGSRNTPPTPGDWYGIYLGGNAGDSEFHHVTVAHAGRESMAYVHNSYRQTAIHVDSCSPRFDHLTVAASQYNGLELWASRSAINDLIVRDCGRQALLAQANSWPTLDTVLFSGNGASGNGSYTVGMDASSLPLPTRATFTGNRMSGIQIWGGTLGASGTWRSWATNAPYVVTDDVTVDAGATLDLEAGATVKFQKTGLYVNGSLNAKGVPAQIAFTSWCDDGPGGDSNGDGAATTPAPGDWKGIYLAAAAGAPLFDHCLFRYAGRDSLGYIHNAYRYVTVYADGCSPQFLNCVISDSGRHGLEFWSSSGRIENCQLGNFSNGGYAVVQDTLDCHLQMANNTGAGAGFGGIALPGGTVATDVTLNHPGPGFGYFLNGELTIAEGVTLTLDPGVTLQTAGQRVMIYGTIRALGTAAAPILFTSRNDPPAPGDWFGVYLGPKAGASLLKYVTVSYAGRDSLSYLHNTYRQTAIHVDSCSPTFDHLTVARSQYNGLELWASQAAINDLAVQDCGRYGLVAETGSWPTISTAFFGGNGTNGVGAYTIGMDASSVPVPAFARFATNRMSGIQVWGGTLGASATWKHWATNAPYVVTADMSVGSGATLSIEAGATVKFRNSGLYVSGQLEADGELGGITLTSWRDDSSGGDSNGDGDGSAAAPGDWKGLYLSPASGDSFLRRCAFRHAGQDSLGYLRNAYRSTTLFVDYCSPVIESCSVTDSRVHGIELWSGSPRLRDNSFARLGNGGYAVVFDTLDCYPPMSGQVTDGSGLGAIAVPGGTMGASGQWTHAGTNFPYLINGDVSVGGGAVLTLDPGVTVLSGLPGFYVSGTLIAVGTPALPVRFASRKDAPAPGDWKGIYLGPGAGNSVLRYLTIEHAGADNLGYINNAYRRTALYVEGSAPELADLRVSQSGAYGVTLAGSSARLNNSLLYSNANHHLWIILGGAPQIVNNTVVSGRGSGIWCAAGTPLIGNNIVAFNQGTGISREGGTPELRNNCVSGNVGANYDRLTAGTGDLSGDPQFVDLPGLDYHLAGASPALNMGSAALTQPDWTDLDGRLRLRNGLVDIGAYQVGTDLARRLVDGLIRNAGESAYLGENTTAVDQQTKQQTVVAGQTAVFQFRLQYQGNLADRLRVAGPWASAGWTVKYFNAATGGEDITLAIAKSGGWVWTNATPGGARELRVEVTPDSTVAGYAIQEVLLTAMSLGDPTQADTLRARTVNAPRAQIDFSLSRPSDIRYTGEDIYNLDAANQTLRREIEPGRKAVFYLRASNRGNIPDTFLVSGLGGDGAWTVRYFDSLLGTNEITPLVAHGGWTNLSLARGQSREFRLEVNASATATGGESKEVLVRASSLADATQVDTVRAVTLVSSPASTPQGRTYTTDGDFDDNGNGVLVGVEYRSVHDQLQLSREAVTLPFIWVPNSNEGSISKVDTRTGRELARYRTVPAGVNGDPSRTTVDQQGNCWIVNRRGGSVVKFGLLENGQYNDRNGNGLIETSQDVNDDGDIAAAELLPWGKDECVLFEVVLLPDKEGTYVPGAYAGPYNETPYPRAIAVDAGGNVWVGAYNLKQYFYLDGQTGKILRKVDVSSVNHTPYGAVIDAQGILWSAGADKNHLLRLDPADNSFKTIDIGHTVYGLGLDSRQHLFISGWQSVKLSRLNVLTGVKDWTVDGIAESRGVAVTDDGDVWVANSSPGTVARWSNDGVLKKQIAVGATPTGVSVDADGKVWVVNNGDEYIHRIDPATSEIDLTKRLVGGLHYGYSDMTGIISRTATTRFGRWTVIHNAKVADTPWGTVTWHALEPTGTSVKVRVRSSNDQATWSLWEDAANGTPLAAVPAGKYLQLEVTLQVVSGDVSPVLYDLTVAPSGTAVVGQLIYQNNFQDSAGPEWSVTQIGHTPLGGRAFLGPWGNTNATLTLNDLPAHSAVTVDYDLFVIGPWDGNGTNNGVSRFTTDLAGGLKLLDSTFNNAPENGAAYGQSYPQAHPATFPARTGAAETNTLGFSLDTVYHLSHTFPHTATPLVLNFGASGLTADERWGIANVRVHITPTAVFRLTPLRLRTDGFHLNLQGEAQKAYVLEASTNLLQWSSIGTIQLQSSSVEVTDSGATNAARRFYRGRLAP